MKTTKILMAMMFAMAMGIGAGCSGDEDINVDAQALGYWIESSPEGNLYIDGDGYGWGVKVDSAGYLTDIRLDWNAGLIHEEANGPFGRLKVAENGYWELNHFDAGLQTGSYHIGSITSSEGSVHPFMTWSSNGNTEYYTLAAYLLIDEDEARLKAAIVQDPEFGV